MSRDLPRLVLYHRAGCHLCDDLHKALAPWMERLRLELVDVDSSPELQRRYGEFVPVLTTLDGHELSRYFLDESRLAQYLAEGLAN